MRTHYQICKPKLENMNSTTVQDSEFPAMEQKGKSRSCVTNDSAKYDLIYETAYRHIESFGLSVLLCLAYSYNFCSTGADLRTFWNVWFIPE